MRLLPVAVLALLLTACSSPDIPPVDPLSRATLLRYDANKDGKVTRAELDKGLAAEFAAADLNHDGKLDTAEVAALNDARWKIDASRTSPVQDWNQDGFVDPREFGTEIVTLFNQIDLNHDGTVTADELSPPSQARPNGPPGGGRGGRGGEGGGRGGRGQ